MKSLKLLKLHANWVKHKVVFLLVLGFFAACSSTPLPENKQVKIPDDFAGVVHVSKIRSASEFQMLRDMGVRWVLATFYWSTIENERGKWNFADYDDFIARNKAAGNKIVIVLAYDTPWLYKNRKRKRRIDAKNLDHFLNFVEVTVKRYENKVDAWEIWNEPNGVFWKGSRADYLALHKRTAEVIRGVRKDAFILGGAFWRSPKFLAGAMFKYGAFDQVDAIAFHPYGINPVDSVRVYDKMRRVFDRHNFRGEVWITEAGYPTGGWYPSRVSEDQFPSYIIKTMAGLAARGARTILWYELIDSYNRGQAPNRFDSEAFFGLLYPDLTRKKGAEAFSLCARYFAGAEYLKEGITREKLPASLISFYFKRQEGGVLVLWNDTHTSLPLHIEGLKTFTLHDVIETKAEQKDGAAPIQVGNMPVFITWQNSDQTGTINLSALPRDKAAR